MGSSDVARTGRAPTNPNATAPASTTAPKPAVTPQPPAGAATSLVVADTFKRLTPDVASGRISNRDAQMLAEQASRRGVIGEAQAVSAARKAASLPPADRAQFQDVVDRAGSNTERAFIYKALAAGHPVPEVVKFADGIRGLSDLQLLHDYTLSGATSLEDNFQSGIAQQHPSSCVPTVAQALRGEADPIYAHQVRSQNPDVHQRLRPGANQAAAREQEDLLEQVGNGHVGTPATPDAPVATPDVGVSRTKIDAVLNSVSQQTGLTYTSQQLEPNERSVDAQEKMLDRMATQLQRGIPTPFEMRTRDDTQGHQALAIAVEGSGDAQRFLVHDPGTGNTAWLTRQEFEWGTSSFDKWGPLRLAGYARGAEHLPAQPRTDGAR